MICTTNRNCQSEGGHCVWNSWECSRGEIKNHPGCQFGQSCCAPRGGNQNKCEQLNGKCQYFGINCLGKLLTDSNLCPTFRQCCIPLAPVSDCRSKGGNCVRNSFQCFGGTADYTCPSRQQCCLPTGGNQNKCEQLNGKCQNLRTNCLGKLLTDSDLCPTFYQCCIPLAPGSDCRSRGGNCVRNTWQCIGSIADYPCPSRQQCCLPRGPIFNDGKSCRRRGGKCTAGHCHGEVIQNEIFGIELCDENTMCCLDDPDKKCKDACGECKDERRCNGKIIKGLCGGKKVCCFKIDKKKHAGCIAKGGSNAVCMKIECNGYFQICNKNTQSQFCPDHKKMECCFPKGKKPKPGAANCKAAGGECDCNPCPGEYFPNKEGNQLCDAGKKCCIIDPMLKCKQGGGKCQLKTVKCKGPYLSGFCGPGAAVCCFEGDFMKLQTTGASEKTAKGAGGRISKLKGVKASEAMAEDDLGHLKKLKTTIDRVAAKTGVDAAIIAAITSRETRGGRPEHTKNPESFGAMQFDGAKKRDDPLSEEHFQEATQHFVQILKEIFGKFPCWSLESKLRGAIAGYNLGSGGVKTIDEMDKGTPGDDYSADVVARAKWLRANKHF